jgi:uncharacterized lipoprotein YajG
MKLLLFILAFVALASGCKKDKATPYVVKEILVPGQDSIHRHRIAEPVN